MSSRPTPPRAAGRLDEDLEWERAQAQRCHRQPPAEVPVVVGGFVVLHLLGSGRSGLLYAARHRRSGRRAILRFLVSRTGLDGIERIDGVNDVDDTSFFQEAVGLLPPARGGRHPTALRVRLADGRLAHLVVEASTPAAVAERRARPSSPGPSPSPSPGTSRRARGAGLVKERRTQVSNARRASFRSLGRGRPRRREPSEVRQVTPLMVAEGRAMLGSDPPQRWHDGNQATRRVGAPTGAGGAGGPAEASSTDEVTSPAVLPSRGSELLWRSTGVAALAALLALLSARLVVEPLHMPPEILVTGRASADAPFLGLQGPALSAGAARAPPESGTAPSAWPSDRLAAAVLVSVGAAVCLLGLVLLGALRRDGLRHGRQASCEEAPQRTFSMEVPSASPTQRLLTAAPSRPAPRQRR